MALDKSARLELTEALASPDGGQPTRRLLRRSTPRRPTTLARTARAHRHPRDVPQQDPVEGRLHDQWDLTVKITNPHGILYPLAVDPAAPDRCCFAAVGDGGLRPQGSRPARSTTW